MTIITTEIQKWKRNKIVWCILALTLLLGAFAIERACSISRSSPFMDSFGDLYTLAFKNMSSLFLPIVLGMFATTLFFDEHKNDTMKELLIIPITKAQLYFSKVAVVILMSVGLCLITFLLCVVGGLIAGGFPDLNAQTLMDAGLLYLAGGILIPIAMLPIVFLSTLSKGYILPIGATLLYLIPVVIAPAYLRERDRDKERDREGTLRPRLWPLPECFPDGRGNGRFAGQFSHCMGPVHRKAVRIHGLYR